MDEYDKLDAKQASGGTLSPLEFAVWYCTDTVCAKQAAAELAALREQVQELEKCNNRLFESIKLARRELQSTQINWQEDCLFECNDILTSALNVCPSCTWRGEVELANGICPQCGTDWHALRKDRLSEAEDIIFGMTHATNADEREAIIGEAKDYVKQYGVTA